jgi:hypothetical protein
LIGISFSTLGCNPTTLTEREDTIEPKSEETIPPEQILTPQPQTSPKELSLTLLHGPWEKYLSAPPKILILKNPTKGIRDLLAEEQSLIKSMLDADASLTETSEHSGLTDRLDELKAAAPSAETSSGYVRSNRRNRHTYISGNTIYTNSNSYYYSYSVFRAKQKSSSPDLVRSVTGIAANASLEDLDQRIDAFQHLISSWSRRTSVMSPNGTSGIMRDANEAYLAGLKGYTQEFIKIQKELRKIEQAQAYKAQNKAGILKDWQTFENTRLSILKDYFNSSALETVQHANNRSYTLNEAQLARPLILACKIGPRVVYFELDERRHPNHPFILADITTPSH